MFSDSNSVTLVFAIAILFIWISTGFTVYRHSTYQAEKERIRLLRVYFKISGLVILIPLVTLAIFLVDMAS